MKKILHIFIVFFLGIGFLGTTNTVLAAQCTQPISGIGVTKPEYPETTSHVITIDLSLNFDDDEVFKFELEEDGDLGVQARSVEFKKNQNITNACYNGEDCVTVKDGIATWTITSPNALMETNIFGRTDTKNIDLRYSSGHCDIGDIQITDVSSPGSGCKIKVFQNRDGGQCYLNKQQNSCFKDNEPVIVEVSDLKDGTGNYWTDYVGLRVKQYESGGEENGSAVKPVDGAASLTFTPGDIQGSARFGIKVEDRGGANEAFPNCEFELTTTEGCSADQCEPETELEIGLAPTSVAQEAFSLCKQIPPELSTQRANCEACTGGTGDFEGNEGVWTAIGCINRQPQAILQKFITVGLGMSGGVALLTFLAAGFIFSTSQGDPKAYGTAKEMMTASIVGILFVIFSITILQFIGYEILKIPGFGGP